MLLDITSRVRQHQEQTNRLEESRFRVKRSIWFINRNHSSIDSNRRCRNPLHQTVISRLSNSSKNSKFLIRSHVCSRAETLRQPFPAHSTLQEVVFFSKRICFSIRAMEENSSLSSSKWSMLMSRPTRNKWLPHSLI